MIDAESRARKEKMQAEILQLCKGISKGVNINNFEPLPLADGALLLTHKNPVILEPHHDICRATDSIYDCEQQ